MRRCRILALSGSLRSGSTNTALLEAARRLAPDGVDIDLYAGLAALPAFNPDLDRPGCQLPTGPAALRSAVGNSDALLIACPEYAHGIPGAFKNALDWLVGGPEFPGKPIALLHASLRGSFVRASLEEVLTTMSGRLVPAAGLAIHLMGRCRSAAEIASDPDAASRIRQAVAALAAATSDDAPRGHPAVQDAGRPIPV